MQAKNLVFILFYLTLCCLCLLNSKSNVDQRCRCSWPHLLVKQTLLVRRFLHQCVITLSLQPISLSFHLLLYLMCRFGMCRLRPGVRKWPVSAALLSFAPVTAAQIKFGQPWPGWYFPPSSVLSDEQEQLVSLPPFLTQDLWPESHQDDCPTCQGTITRARDRYIVQWWNVTGNVAPPLSPPCVFWK